LEQFGGFQVIGKKNQDQFFAPRIKRPRPSKQNKKKMGKKEKKLKQVFAKRTIQ
jgi:hypothetical protein